MLYLRFMPWLLSSHLTPPPLVKNWYPLDRRLAQIWCGCLGGEKVLNLPRLKL
jgi:hypothetical protein